MKKITFLFSALLMVLSVSAAKPFKPADARQLGLDTKVGKVFDADVLRRNAPQVIADDEEGGLTITAEQVAAGVGIIYFDAAEFDGYDNYLFLSQGDETIAYAEVDNIAYGEYGILTPDAFGIFLEEGEYTITFQATVWGMFLAGEAETTLTITEGREGDAPRFEDLQAELDEAGKTIVTWDISGELDEDATFSLYVQSTKGEVVYDSYETNDVIASPFTLDLAEGAGYYIMLEIVPSYSQNIYQILAEDYTTISINNPYEPTDLKAEVNGLDVRLTWTSEEKPYRTIVYILDEEGYVETSFRTSVQDTTITLTRPGTFSWYIRPYAENGYYSTVAYTYSTEDFTTVDIVAPVIEEVSVARITGTLVELAVTASDNYTAVGDLLYTVRNGRDVLLENVALNEKGRLILSDLTVSTTYENITVTAIDEAGNESEAVAVTEFTTLAEDDAVAPVLESVEVVELTARTAAIKLTATDNVDTAADLIARIAIAENDVRDIEAVEGLYIITGLTPETTYNVTVKAVDLTGNESEARAVEFTTTEIVPIELFPEYADAPNYGDGNWYLNLYAYSEELEDYAPDIYLDLYGVDEALTGVYTIEEETLGDYWTYFDDVEGQRHYVVDGTVEIECVGFQFEEEVDGYLGLYDIEFTLTTEDGDVYFGTMQNVEVLTYDAGGEYYILPTGEENYPDEPAGLIEAQAHQAGLDLTQPIYNILGQKVEAQTQQILIQNGQKFILR